MNENSVSMEDSSNRSGLSRTPAPVRRKKRQSLRVMLLSGPFEVRGSSTQTLLLAEQLPSYGIEGTIVTPDFRSVAPERRRQLQVREYPYLKMPVVNRIVSRFITQDFRENPPDLIHLQSRFLHSTAISLAKTFRCPYLLTVHDYLNPARCSLLIRNGDTA